jgi:hypothetical protein
MFQSVYEFVQTAIFIWKWQVPVSVVSTFGYLPQKMQYFTVVCSKLLIITA